MWASWWPPRLRFALPTCPPLLTDDATKELREDQSLDGRLPGRSPPSNTPHARYSALVYVFPSASSIRVSLLEERDRRCGRTGEGAGGTGERVAREPLTGRVSRGRKPSGGERTGRRARDPDPLRGQGPLPLGQDPRPRTAPLVVFPGCRGGSDGFDHGGVGQRRRVAERRPVGDVAQKSSHDLSRTRLR